MPPTIPCTREPSSSPGTSQEANYATTVTYKPVQPLALLGLLLLPLPERSHEHIALQDEVKVQPQKHRHPRLRELVVAARVQPISKRADKMKQLVGLVVARGADAEGAQLQVCRGGRQSLEMLDERVV